MNESRTNYINHGNEINRIRERIKILETMVSDNMESVLHMKVRLYQLFDASSSSFDRRQVEIYQKLTYPQHFWISNQNGLDNKFKDFQKQIDELKNENLCFRQYELMRMDHFEKNVNYQLTQILDMVNTVNHSLDEVRKETDENQIEMKIREDLRKLKRKCKKNKSQTLLVEEQINNIAKDTCSNKEVLRSLQKNFSELNEELNRLKTYSNSSNNHNENIHKNLRSTSIAIAVKGISAKLKDSNEEFNVIKGEFEKLKSAMYSNVDKNTIVRLNVLEENQRNLENQIKQIQRSNKKVKLANQSAAALSKVTYLKKRMNLSYSETRKQYDELREQLNTVECTLRKESNNFETQIDEIQKLVTKTEERISKLENKNESGPFVDQNTAEMDNIRNQLNDIVENMANIKENTDILQDSCFTASGSTEPQPVVESNKFETRIDEIQKLVTKMEERISKLGNKNESGPFDLKLKVDRNTADIDSIRKQLNDIVENMANITAKTDILQDSRFTTSVSTKPQPVLEPNNFQERIYEIQNSVTNTNKRISKLEIENDSGLYDLKLKFDRNTVVMDDIRKELKDLIKNMANIKEKVDRIKKSCFTVTCIAKPLPIDGGSTPSPLMNVNLNCYLNAVLQALSSCSLLCNRFAELSEQYGSLNHLATLNDLLSLMITQDTTKPYAFSHSSIFNDWNKIGQQDAFELMSYLLNQVFKEIKNELENLGEIKKSSLPEWLEIILPMRIKMRYRIICSCGFETHSPLQTDLALHLSIPPQCRKSFEIQELLNHHFLPEDVEEHSCTNCDASSAKKFTTLIHPLPETLCIHLQRSFWTGESMCKIQGSVTFSDNICVTAEKVLSSNNASKPSIDLNYDLVAVIVHYGETDGGHYVCYRNVDKQWYLIDDSYITKVLATEVLQCHPYVLFYEISTRK